MNPLQAALNLPHSTRHWNGLNDSSARRLFYAGATTRTTMMMQASKFSQPDIKSFLASEAYKRDVAADYDVLVGALARLAAGQAITIQQAETVFFNCLGAGQQHEVLEYWELKQVNEELDVATAMGISVEVLGIHRYTAIVLMDNAGYTMPTKADYARILSPAWEPPVIVVMSTRDGQSYEVDLVELFDRLLVGVGGAVVPVYDSDGSVTIHLSAQVAGALGFNSGFVFPSEMCDYIKAIMAKRIPPLHNLAILEEE